MAGTARLPTIDGCSPPSEPTTDGRLVATPALPPTVRTRHGRTDGCIPLFQPGQTLCRWLSSIVGAFFERTENDPGETWASPALEAEQTKYGAYLSEVRGLSRVTISSRLRRLRLFFQFLCLDRRPVNFQNLRLSHVEAYLRTASRSNSRTSLHCIVCCLRGFLKFKHAAGQLRQPLHRQIEAPCVYQMGKLPRAIPWSKIQELLRSIDCSEPFGLHDFTMIYLAAAYGLRRSEVARLTLDDIDWRARTLPSPSIGATCSMSCASASTKWRSKTT